MTGLKLGGGPTWQGKRGCRRLPGAATEGVSMGFFVLDKAGGITGVNRLGLDLLRRRHLPPGGRLRLAACVHPADRRRFRTFLREAHGGPGAEPAEFWLQARRAVPRCVQIIATPGSSGWTVAAWDVTARRSVESALRRRNTELGEELAEAEDQLRAGLTAVAKRERQLAEIFQSALDAIVLVSPEGRIVRFNPAAERMFGWPAARIAGEHVVVLVPPRYRLTLRQDLRRAARDGCLHVGSLPPRQALRADGREFPVEVSFARTGEGPAAGTVVFVRDVSERVEALRGMVENWRALTDFFDSAPLGLLWLRPDGQVERVNEAALEILSRPRSAVQGHPLGALGVEGAALEGLLAALRGGQTLHNQRFQVRRPDGSLRHILIDANGWWREQRLTHCQLFVRDITLRLELERELLTVAEREQERIGHELHDDLCQQLTAIEFLSESLAGRLARDTPRAARELREISGLIRAASRQTREIARGLSLRAVFHKGGLGAALQDFAQRTRKAYRCGCRFSDRAELPLTDPVLCANLFRIAQEAVANALRHGRATRLELSLAARGDDLVLEVRNNGQPLPATPKDGLGLRTMQHRAGVIGGRLELVRRPRGLSVVCTVTDALRAARGRPTVSA